MDEGSELRIQRHAEKRASENQKVNVATETKLYPQAPGEVIGVNRGGMTEDTRLGQFLYTIWDLRKERLGTEEIFDAVDVLTERDIVLEDLAHRRRVTYFLFFISVVAFLFAFLIGKKVIDLPISFFLGTGGVSGVWALLRLFLKSGSVENSERRNSQRRR